MYIMFMFIAHNPQDADFSKMPASTISKVENVRLSALKQTDIVKFLK